ncbi:hypothetical protein [Streptomyces sp. NPDC051286]|uniref:hypothetical protein n=1 Tax=Streptomyces sp. NPDC051286 TaxID=3365647 RepID=UPI0037B338E2
MLFRGVTLLHPEDAVFDAMLEGWARQQRSGLRLAPDTLSDRLGVVRRFDEEGPQPWPTAHSW